MRLFECVGLIYCDLIEFRVYSLSYYYFVFILWVVGFVGFCGCLIGAWFLLWVCLGLIVCGLVYLFADYWMTRFLHFYVR